MTGLIRHSALKRSPSKCAARDYHSTAAVTPIGCVVGLLDFFMGAQGLGGCRFRTFVINRACSAAFTPPDHF
jgi:hypothetical protein